MQLTGAEIVIRCLQEEGVEYVFGYPGGAVLNIYDELFKQDKVKHVLVRHEQGAVHAESLHEEGETMFEELGRVRPAGLEQLGQRREMARRASLSLDEFCHHCAVLQKLPLGCPAFMGAQEQPLNNGYQLTTRRLGLISSWRSPSM